MVVYKQTLLREDAYNQLVAAKERLRSLYERRITLSDAINLMIGRRLNLLYLPKEMQEYISGFVKIASEDRQVLGVLLFGSVAKGTYGKYSDIDLLVMVRGRAKEHLQPVHEMVQSANPLADRLADTGIYSYITPIVLGSDNSGRFSPLYAAFVDEGITLFDRDGALAGFLSDVGRMGYTREELAGAMVIRWKHGGRGDTKKL
jgi:predicted nucleotidyltransferase